eukprot:Platyproteum_vivax@DN4563_c0_g1_i2.p1
MCHNFWACLWGDVDADSFHLRLPPTLCHNASIDVAERVRTHNNSLLQPTKALISGGALMSAPHQPIPWTRNLIRALFTVLVVGLDYSLMLAAMTFNIGIFCAVVFGFGLGAFCFGHTLFKTTDNEAIAPCCSTMH